MTHEKKFLKQLFEKLSNFWARIWPLVVILVVTTYG